MTTSQPAPIRMIVGTTASGCEDERDDDRRRPRHERPEERDHLEEPRRDRGERGQRQPEQQVRAERDQEVDEAHQRLAAQEATERARDRRLEEARLLRVGRRDDPEQEGQDRVAVDDHVDRQEEDDQHRPDDAQAGDRDLLQRLDEGAGDRVEVAEGGLRLGDEVDLAEPDRVQPRLPRREDRRQVRLDVRELIRRTGRSRSPARRRR